MVISPFIYFLLISFLVGAIIGRPFTGFSSFVTDAQPTTDHHVIALCVAPRMSRPAIAVT
jgi:hypothetical protein